VADPPRRSRADDLSRRRSRTYRAPETGRVHHLGQAPAQQPVSTEEGLAWTEAARVRLQRMMIPQVEALGADLRRRMAAAAEALDFEEAGRLRDELAGVDAELVSRQRGSG
jgi:excinuclease UvrABC nuclease subunit